MSMIPMTETQLQIALVKWCRLQRDERRWIMHLPNEGKRSRAGHGIQIAMGLLPGASDLFLPAQRNGYAGLFLELKTKGKRPNEMQKTFGEAMHGCGYCSQWADNLDDAMMVIARYMDGEMVRPGWVYYSRPVTI
jgi:hypothetical protein